MEWVCSLHGDGVANEPAKHWLSEHLLCGPCSELFAHSTLTNLPSKLVRWTL